MWIASIFIAALLGHGQQPPAAPPEQAEIVVTAVRRGVCQVALADRALSDRQFERHAGEWARLGRAVRVVHPVGVDYRCLSRIAFRLYDRGVRLVHFVDREEAARRTSP